MTLQTTITTTTTTITTKVTRWWTAPAAPQRRPTNFAVTTTMHPSAPASRVLGNHPRRPSRRRGRICFRSIHRTIISIQLRITINRWPCLQCLWSTVSLPPHPSLLFFAFSNTVDSFSFCMKSFEPRYYIPLASTLHSWRTIFTIWISFRQD